MLDNYGTNRTPEVKARLAQHPRFHLQFTPTSALWLNLNKRFFAKITMKRIRRGAFASLAELEQAIPDFLDESNTDSKPLVWAKSTKPIIKKELKALQQLALAYDGNQTSVSEH